MSKRQKKSNKLPDGAPLKKKARSKDNIRQYYQYYGHAEMNNE